MSTFFQPFRIKKISKHINGQQTKILDIGSGSHSASITKKWIKGCQYTGVDKNQGYRNDTRDIDLMDNFIELDLTALDFKTIPEDYYDVIIMSHVIEHLHNGDEVLKGLMPKLKKDGIFYVEFPSERSTQFPSRRETLNFFDDPTHCRIFSIKEICNIFMKYDYQVIEAKTRRSYFNIALMPIKIVLQFFTKGYVKGGVFWDFYGFADYVIVRKK